MGKASTKFKECHVCGLEHVTGETMCAESGVEAAKC